MTICQQIMKAHDAIEALELNDDDVVGWGVSSLQVSVQVERAAFVRLRNGEPIKSHGGTSYWHLGFTMGDVVVTTLVCADLDLADAIALVSQ